MQTKFERFTDLIAALFLLCAGGGIGVGGTWHHASGMIAEKDAALSEASAKLEQAEAGLSAERAAVSTAWHRQMATERRLAKTEETLKLALAAQADVEELVKAVNELTGRIKVAPAKVQKPVEKPQVNTPADPVPVPAPAPAKPAPAATEKIEPQVAAQDNANRMLAALNSVRAKHALPPLAWSKKLMDSAGAWAQGLIKDCERDLEHDPAWSGGENLAKGYFTPEEAVAAWAAEEKDFDLASNTCAEGKVCGHWTQIVWRDTEEVGCQQYKCADGSPVLACRFFPAGNFIGKRPF